MDGRPQTVLVFDGDCGFCTTAVRWLERVLPAMPTAIPYQWADLDALGVSRAEAADRVWLVDAGRRFGGHRAVGMLLRHQPRLLLRVLGRLAFVPPWSWAAAAGYRAVARYRWALPGGTPACRTS